MEKELPKIIWIMWYQGFEVAPVIVKKCLQTWEKHNPDWMINKLTSETIGNYIDVNTIVPDYKEKQLPLEALSDIVRIALLNTYGGVWVDSTVYCNEPLDKWLYAYTAHSRFFAFANPGPDRMLSNWFLAACSDNAIIKTLTQNTISYWSIRNERHHYFWFHYLFADIYYTDPDFQKRWDAVPKFSADGPHFFIPYEETFAQDLTKKIKSQIDQPTVPVFKLTHKYNQAILNKKSVLSYLINGQSKNNLFEKIFAFIQGVYKYPKRS